MQVIHECIFTVKKRKRKNFSPPQHPLQRLSTHEGFQVVINPHRHTLVFLFFVFNIYDVMLDVFCVWFFT